MTRLENTGTPGGQASFDLTQNQTAGETSTTQKPVTLSDFQTVMVSLGYTDDQINYYVNNPGQPLLVTPQDSGVTVFDTGELLNHVLDGTSSNSSSVPDKTFGEQFQERLGALLNDPNFLNDIGAKTPEIAEIKIKLALIDPDNLSSPELEKALKSLTEGFPKDWAGGEVDSFLKEIAQRKDNVFEDVLGKMADPKDATALKNAYFNNTPETLTDAQKTMFNEIMKATNAELQQTFGIPANLKLPSVGKEYFNTLVNLSFEDGIIVKLMGLKVKGDAGMPGGISEKEFNTLKTMLYFKDPTNPAQKELESKFNFIYDKVLTQFKSDNGLPDSWTPTPQTAAGQAYSDGMWRDAFIDKLSKLEIPQELKDQIFQGLANPSSASPIVQTMLSALVAQTTAEIIENLGLPASWKPVGKISDPNVPLQTILMGKAAIANLQNIYDAGMKMLREMPAGDPRRSLLMNYLKSVGTALSDMQTMLFIVQGANASASKTLSLAMQDMQKNKVEEMKKQAEQTKTQRNSKGYKKANDPGKQLFMKIFGPIMAVFMMLLAVFTCNPILMAVALFMLSSSVSKVAGGPDLMQKAFQAITDLVALICQAMGMSKEATAAITAAVKIIVMVAVCAMAMVAGGGGMIGSMVVMNFLMDALSKSDLAIDFLKMGNPNPTQEEIQKAQMTFMIVTMVVMMTIMIVQMIAMAAASMGTSVAPQAGLLVGVATTMGSVGASLSSALTVFMVNAMTKFPALVNVFLAITKAIQAVINVVQMVVKFVQMVINVLKQVTQFVFDTVSQLADFIKDGAKHIVYLLGNAFTALSEATPQTLQNAGQSLSQAIGGLCDDLASAGQRILNLLKNNCIMDAVQRAFPQTTSTATNQGGAAGNVPGSTGINRVAGVMGAAGEVGQGIHSVVSGVTQAQYSLMMANLVRQQALTSSYIEEVDALIKLMKAAIQALLDSMRPLADFVQSISDLQIKKFQDASSASGWNAI